MSRNVVFAVLLVLNARTIVIIVGKCFCENIRNIIQKLIKIITVYGKMPQKKKEKNHELKMYKWIQHFIRLKLVVYTITH